MLYGNLSWPEIEALDKDNIVVIAPLASLEQHGHHLPLLTDAFLATAVAEGVHAKFPEQAVLLPTLWLGASDHHLDFPGTVTVCNTDYVKIIQQMAASLVSAGFWRILFLNGHGGNVAPGEVAITQLANEHDQVNEAYLVLASYWTVAADAMHAEQHGMTQPSLSHACEYETSLMLHLHRSLVQMERARGDDAEALDLPPGVRVSGRFNLKSETGALGRPELATAEKGASLLTAIVDEVSTLVETMLHWPLRELTGPIDPE